MNEMRNTVQLIGHVGTDPDIISFEGKKKANFVIATNEVYRNEKGDKVEETQWHHCVAWGKNAEIIEKYICKGKELALNGKLIHRSYEKKNGDKCYITEVVIRNILLMGK